MIAISGATFPTSGNATESRSFVSGASAALNSSNLHSDGPTGLLLPPPNMTMMISTSDDATTTSTSSSTTRPTGSTCSKKRFLEQPLQQQQDTELCFLHKRLKSGRTSPLSRKRIVRFDESQNTIREATACAATTPAVTSPAQIVSSTATPPAQTHPEYSAAELWWTRSEMAQMMQRHASLLDFYFDVCPGLVEHVIVLWLSCATYMEQEQENQIQTSTSTNCSTEQHDASTTTSTTSEADAGDMIHQTPAERAATALMVAQSPLRGLEKDICRAWMSAHRMDHSSRILELQHACQQAQLTPQVQAETIAPMAGQGTCVSNLFAQVLAAADQYIAKGEQEQLEGDGEQPSGSQPN